MNRILLFCLFFYFTHGFAQKTDFLKIAKYRVSYLSDSLRETSGLTLSHGRLFTINDGGNSSEIFEIDKSSGKILRTLKTQLANKDWEAFANDSLHFYIGDFGNNAGTRKDLRVYQIPFDSAKTSKELAFFYPEQKDFSPKVIKTDFDAEAMIVWNGQIHIFTKEWSSRSTTHYLLNPEWAENQAAEKVESFHTGFFVTDAAYFQGKLYLIGYTKNTEVFLSVFNETQPGVFFKQKPKKYYLGSALAIGQIEGIAVDESGIYISGEELRTPLGTAKQALYFVQAGKLK